MGIVISKSTYPPFALVTGIIGIISFIFTLGTFLKVVWINLETMAEAPHEVHSYLTNLRTELLEEKASIRLMRKHRRKFQRAPPRNSLLGIELDDVSLKTMGDVIRQLCRRFKELERPFLEDGEDGMGEWKDRRRRARRRDSEDGEFESLPEKGRRRKSRRDSEDGEYSSPPEKGRHRSDRDDQDDDDLFWAQRTQYAKLDLKRRLIWLRKKSEAQALSESLSRIQIRRIARQVGGISVLTHEYGQTSLQMEDMIRRMDERMNRIVGVRRVD